MIIKNSVFILGAGSSSDFGFPLGQNLRNEIINTFSNPNHQNVQNVAQAICEPFPNEFKDYIPTITKFAQKLHDDGDYSIDAFLERFQESFLVIGKLAIAQVLARHEIEGGISRTVDNWYRIVYSRMKKGASLDTFHQNKVAFINFNYDRSLEHFLYTSLLSFHEKIREEHVKDIISRIPIIHLYGQLDP